MIGRSVLTKVALFAIITVVGVTYVLFHYIGVGKSLFGNGFTAYVDLRDSGGIFTSASVTYRGVDVGRVGTIRITRTGIRVALNLNGTIPVPNDLKAIVGNGSAIGEQFIDLQPQAAISKSTQYLHAGSLIPQSATSLPVSTNELLVNLDKLVTSLPKDSLKTTVRELGNAFRDTGPSLQHLLDTTDSLISSATDNLPQTISLLHLGGQVLDTQNDLSPLTQDWTTEFASFFDQLRRSDADLRGVLDKGAPAARQLTDLVHRLDVPLTTLLSNGVALGNTISSRTTPLRMELILYPYIIATSFSAFHGGYAHFGLPFPPTSESPVCNQGYDTSYDRPPDAYTATNAFPYDTTCKVPTNANQLVRGARNAPLPDGSRIGDQPDYGKDVRAP